MQKLTLTLVSVRVEAKVFFNNYTAQQVRGNSDLLGVFIELYEGAFGRKPTCSGCAINSEWVKVRDFYYNPNGQQNKSKMEKTFELKKLKNEIISFHNGNKIIRCYDTKMTEEFAVSFLTNGTKEEIEERKKLFSKLPKSLTKFEEVKAEVPTPPKTTNKRIISQTKKATKPKSKKVKK